ncbi:MAG TPA: hypothetical protein VI937_02425 [Negativicutes bacterium]|uniref:Cell division protein FtsL n=1 Tax=Candidatus Staskawiczbacteria bacterium RIFCSPHIGHO2_01_FULL_41_41 TaxID=1802203 RepID=A0A1G2HVL1_9BACT|nr:MAG: hypothetical protein A2822_02245 [Candidatus Staskawiczbacteria bacterium RIFCSPHIGHO2_01_FULL_41_41]OGZ69144.1 MAG: hypothetical protein A3C50_01985 [Candidatus Staskawiczbacteria bacterium RIFCSPHIGHO2_02_FULL_43_16]OGZ74427.1 MAG: hypothetical protein A3A12_01505 [Candidatus Staskawiczbacteria bacterium RIFCSPLOWO2_01_FULL_43_17b]HLD70712.1 hypothetical protein [Negativicutes bacterium]
MTTIALQHKLRAITLPAVNWKAVYVLGIPALAMMLVFYAYSINKLTGGSYVIKNYHKEISQLQTENNSLEASAANSGVMGNAQARAHYLGFEKTTQVKYIEVGEGALAQAK